MNPTIETILTRRSIRKYKPDMLPREMIDQIIEAGLYAPSGMNTQNTVILAITDKATRDRLSRANAAVMGTDRDPFYGAPTVLVVLADPKATNELNAAYDGALVMGNLMNAAYEIGVGSCWIHRAREVFDSPRGRELLATWGVAPEYRGVGHCILGYPKEASGETKPRKENYIRYI